MSYMLEQEKPMAADKKPRNVTPINDWLEERVAELIALRDPSDGEDPEEDSLSGLQDFVAAMSNQGGRGRPDEIGCNYKGLFSATWSTNDGVKIKVTFKNSSETSFRIHQVAPADPVPAAEVAPTA